MKTMKMVWGALLVSAVTLGGYNCGEAPPAGTDSSFLDGGDLIGQDSQAPVDANDGKDSAAGTDAAGGTDAAVPPTQLVAGTATQVGAGGWAQLWISNDHGETWTMAKDFAGESRQQRAVMALVYDSQHGRFIAGTIPNAQLWASDDGGTTWVLKQDLSNETPRQTYIRTLAYDGFHDTLVAGTYSDGCGNCGQIWGSTDGGETWTLKKDLTVATPIQQMKSLGFLPYSNQLVAGTYPDGQIWLSDDGGVNWSLIETLSSKSPPQQLLSRFVIDPYHARVIAGTAYDAQLWASADGQGPWVLKRDLRVASGGTLERVQGAAFDSAANRLVVGVGYDDAAQIWVSDDGGETWVVKHDFFNETPGQHGVSALTYDGNRGRLLAGTDPNAQVWASDDDGETWILKKDISASQPHLNIVSVLASSGP